MKTIYIAFAVLSASLACSSLNAQQQPGPLQPPPVTQQASPATTNAAAPQAAPVNTPTAPADATTLVVPAGTKLPLVLHNSITTRNAQPGDPVYLETTFPITLDNRVVVPAGSYVQGNIVDAKRPGKVKGTGEVRI